MTRSPILVAGATGKTGRPLVEQLLAKGFAVRALVRREDERSASLRSLGAEVIVGDLLNLESVRQAMSGADRAYFCLPPQSERLIEATTIFAVAAREAGVKTVVNMSQLTARPDAPSPLSRQHWLAEEVFDWADIGAVHVRPTFFAENLYLFGAQTIAGEGRLYLPYGDERHAPIGGADISRVIAEILIRPEPHIGQRYVIRGTENLTIAEMAAVLSEELGRDVEFIDLPIAAWGDILSQVPTMSKSLITHLQAVAQDHKDGVFNGASDIVERLTGEPAQSLGAFVRSNRDAFEPSAAAAVA